MQDKREKNRRYYQEVTKKRKEKIKYCSKCNIQTLHDPDCPKCAERDEQARLYPLWWGFCFGVAHSGYGNS